MTTYTATLSNGETVTRTTKTAWTHIVEVNVTVKAKRTLHERGIKALTKASKRPGADTAAINTLITDETNALTALEGREENEVLSTDVYQWSKSEEAANKVVANLLADGYGARAIALTVEKERTDRYGFPIVPCRRCDGTGMFGPRAVKGGVCFECGGARMAHKRGKVAKAAGEFYAAKRAARQRLTSTLQPGDVAIPWNPTDGRKVADDEWLTIVSVTQTDTECGYSETGTEGTPGYTKTIYYLHEVKIRTAEGKEETRMDASGLIWNLRTPHPVDPTPYLVAAGL